MEKYRIELINNKKISENIRSLIDDYWKRENGKWVYRDIDLAKKYSYGSTWAISDRIRKYSKCFITKKCPNCNQEFERKVNSKGFFDNEIRYDSNSLCYNCRQEKGKEQEKEREREREESLKKQEEWKKKQEEWKKEQEELERNEIERLKNLADEEKYMLDQAVINEKWKELNEYELDVLTKIANNNQWSSIIHNVLCGNLKDTSKWSIIHVIERAGLIILRKNSSNWVDGIDVSENLKPCLNEYLQNNKTISISQDVFEQISRLTQTIQSQQQTIDFLCKKPHPENIAAGA
jgi:hypothetical protein